jgi:protocatechuate 3,4-dioxygenase beta subunit
MSQQRTEEFGIIGPRTLIDFRPVVHDRKAPVSNTSSWRRTIHADPESSAMPRYLVLIGLNGCGLFASLGFAPAQIASADDPKPAAKSVARNTRLDETANEKARRDAAGLLTIEGTVVDESGKPVPKARVRLHAFEDRVPTALTDGQGRFRFLSVDLPTARYLSFVADNPKDGTKGYVTIFEEGTLGFPAPVQVVLRPPREFIVAVNDQKGDSVAGALVEVSAQLHSIDEGRTGPDGTIRFRLPADARVNQVIARKSGAGFDYWADRVDRNAGPAPLARELALTLNGARTVRVHAIDRQGRPVPGVNVVPWVITKQGQTNSVNLTIVRSQLERAETDSNGVATIDWLPVDLANAVTFLAHSYDVHLPKPPRLEPDPKDDVVDLEMQLLRATKISGTVRTAEDKPAVGIVLQAEGRGDTNHYFRDLARTNAEGAFEFLAYPEQSYLISVLDESWAAPSCTVVQLREDQPVGGLELRLNRGTVLRGVATAADGSVQADATVTLIQTAQLPAPARSPQLVRWARTDSEGRYHFRIGPGSYELYNTSHNARIPLTIDAQPEVVHDFRTDK